MTCKATRRRLECSAVGDTEGLEAGNGHDPIYVLRKIPLADCEESSLQGPG